MVFFAVTFRFLLKERVKHYVRWNGHLGRAGGRKFTNMSFYLPKIKYKCKIGCCHVLRLNPGSRKVQRASVWHSSLQQVAPCLNLCLPLILSEVLATFGLFTSSVIQSSHGVDHALLWELCRKCPRASDKAKTTWWAQDARLLRIVVEWCLSSMRYQTSCCLCGLCV